MNTSDVASDYNVVISGTCATPVTSANVSLTVNECITGISSIDAQKDKAVKIYPNPFKSSLFVMINEASQVANCKLKIYDILGNVVISTTVKKQIYTIETSSLPSGIYFYQVIDGASMIQSGKLIAQ